MFTKNSYLSGHHLATIWPPKKEVIFFSKGFAYGYKLSMQTLQKHI